MAGGDGSNGFVLNGIDADDRSGFSVSGAGDLNGDGIDDVVIGAPYADPNGKSFAGESYVVFGSNTGFTASFELSTLDGNNGFVLHGIDAGDLSGISVSNAGDFNGDGIGDLIIGASHAGLGNGSYGESYVVFGSGAGFAASIELSTLDGNNGLLIKGIEPYDYAGFSTSSAGDLNGDGYDDLILGRSDLSTAQSPESYVVFGSGISLGASVELSALNGENGFLLIGIESGNGFGESVSGTGDVNGDGFDDLIVGSFGADPNGNSQAGESYVVFGNNTGFTESVGVSTLDGSNGFVLHGIDAEDYSGISVGGVGDFNGDGIDDLIIGAIYADPNGNSQAGESYVVFGRTDASEERLIYQFDTLADQISDQAFSVSLTATNQLGGFVDNHNATVSLIPGHSTNVAPQFVELVNGTWTGDIVLDTPFTDTRLYALSGQNIGYSNSFSVTSVNPAPELTRIVGQVTDISVAAGATANSKLSESVTVSLEDSDGNVVSVNSESDGSFEFGGLVPGNYTVWAVCGSGNSPVIDVVANNGTTVAIDVSCVDLTRTPVLIVPGIMGSTLDATRSELYPILPSNYADPSELHILEPSILSIDPVGLDDLRETLGGDFRVIDVPWDWRVSLDAGQPTASGDACAPEPPVEEYNVGLSAWERYLLPAIDRALDPDCDGVDDFDKVNIVAHSMGGLLVRAYIQSSLYEARRDIDKFAMVGTPNAGAANAFYMVEGGDPKLADDLNEGRLEDWVNFYTQTTHRLFLNDQDEQSSPFPLSPCVYSAGGMVTVIEDCDSGRYNWNSGNNERIRNYLRSKVPTGRQLLPTYEFLIRNGTRQAPAFESNSFLSALNNDASGLGQLHGADPTKVRTKLFAATNQDTIRDVPVGPPNGIDNLYPNGAPIVDEEETDRGDGTVFVSSVTGGIGPEFEILIPELFALPSLTKDFDGLAVAGKGKHSGLLGDFANDIKEFLCEGVTCVGGRDSRNRMEISQKVQMSSSQLIVNVLSRNQIHVVDPALNGVGVNPVSAIVEQASSNAELSLNASYSGVVFDNPVSGVYEVSVSGVYEEEALQVIVEWVNDEDRLGTRLFAIQHNGVLSFQVEFDPTSDTPLIIDTPATIPTNLRADTMQGVLSILWDETDDPDAAEYRVYGRPLSSPEFTMLATTTGTQFDAVQPLQTDNSGEVWQYVVLAADENGNEGFYTQVFTNRVFSDAGFSSSVTQGLPPLEVTFSDQSLGNPIAWEWDFESDGIIDSTEQNPSHTYVEAGLYTVTMTAAGAGGADSISLSNHIAVGVDSDGDGLIDLGDNCVEIANPLQQDTDGDNIGNACDPDIALPNDCIVNFLDLLAMKASFFSTPAVPGWNPDADFDSSNSVNFSDLFIMKSAFFSAPGPSGLANDCIVQ